VQGRGEGGFGNSASNIISKKRDKGNIFRGTERGEERIVSLEGKGPISKIGGTTSGRGQLFTNMMKKAEPEREGGYQRAGVGEIGCRMQFKGRKGQLTDNGRRLPLPRCGTTKWGEILGWSHGGLRGFKV